MKAAASATLAHLTPHPAQPASDLHPAWALTSDAIERIDAIEAIGAIEAARPADPDPLVVRYLTHVRVEKRLAERTALLYTLDLQRLQTQAAVAGLALTAVHNAHIRRWVVQMHAAGRSGRGIALILSGWRGFYVWLGREGLVASNPVQGVRAPKSAKPLPKALSVDEAVQLAAYERTLSSVGSMNNQANLADRAREARDHCLTELLYGCGLRIGELGGLDARASAAARGWIDLDAAEAHVLGKGGKRRSVPVGGQALLALQHWLAARQMWLAGVQTAAQTDAQKVPEKVPGKVPERVAERTGDDVGRALFVNASGQRLSPQQIRVRLRQRSLQAGLATPVHPHMLRHSFASHVLQSSGDLRAVQELLGHASITSTQIYTRLDFQHLAGVYDAAHPRAHALDAAARRVVKIDDADADADPEPEPEPEPR